MAICDQLEETIAATDKDNSRLRESVLNEALTAGNKEMGMNVFHETAKEGATETRFNSLLKSSGYKQGKRSEGNPAQSLAKS